MSDTNAPNVPPGWHLDPGGDDQLRYWDGSAWTEHVHREVPADEVPPYPQDVVAPQEVSQAAKPRVPTGAKVAIGVLSGVVRLGVIAGAVFAVVSLTAPREPNASAVVIETPSPTLDPAASTLPDNSDDTSALQEKADAPATSPATTKPAPAPVSAPGECPTATATLYSGTTADFSVRICEGQTDTFTYVDGNSELGYTVLPATIGFGTSGTIFTARNGNTAYHTSHAGLHVSPAGEDSWTQPWTSGNMSGLHPGGG